MSGGFEAERAERQAIKDEAEETRRRHRERFDEILEEAKVRACAMVDRVCVNSQGSCQ